jgi:hypothetical protein
MGTPLVRRQPARKDLRKLPEYHEVIRVEPHYIPVDSRDKVQQVEHQYIPIDSQPELRRVYRQSPAVASDSSRPTHARNPPRREEVIVLNP